MDKVLSIAQSCPSAIKFYNMTWTPTYHTDPTLLMHSTVSPYRQDRPYICHAQYSNYIVHCSHPQHNSLPMHTTCTTHPALPTQHYPPSTTHPALPSTMLSATPLLCTQLTNTKCICVGGGKLVQDVGMVWQQAHVGIEPSKTKQSRHHNTFTHKVFVICCIK